MTDRLKFGYFTLTDNSVGYGPRRRDPGELQFEQVEAAGIEEVICYFNFGLLAHAETLHQMERVSREVMPHFAVSREAMAVA
jgi:hypothetical protein